jgi:hypothetical protein
VGDHIQIRGAGFEVFALVVCSMSGVYLTIPAIIAAIGVRAWMNGILRDWWIYEERSVASSACGVLVSSLCRPCVDWA